jgi:predicted Zn-dependent protease with MMP-like domain
VEVSRAEFEQLVADALDGLPESLGRVMDNVVVLVEGRPSAEQLQGVNGTLLGRYEGVALTHRGPLSYVGAMPDRIYIFQDTISERSPTPEALVNLVRRTVIHEVAHHFGISDARLHELGWA